MRSIWLIIAVILLVGFTAAVLLYTPQREPPQVSIPDWLTEFEYDPFGSQEFQSYTRTLDPILGRLKPEYPDIKLYYLAAPIEITPQQAQAKLSELLDANWSWSPGLNSETEWGWSVGYESQSAVYVLLVVEKQSLTDFHYPLIPAAILTNAPLTTSP